MTQRALTLLLSLAVATPLGAQSISSNGMSGDGLRIDSSGVHTRGTDVTASGVRVGSTAAGQTINGNGATRTIDCRNGAVAVNGNHNRLTLANCHRITVTGNDNAVTARFAADGAIEVPGNRNSIAWSAAPRVHVGVNSLGNANHIARR